MQDRITTEGNSLRCPYCEIHELEPTGQNAARCPACRAVIWITQLPDAIGRHACECGHPEMRRLPDGVYRCPACASEVTPVSRSSW